MVGFRESEEFGHYVLAGVESRTVGRDGTFVEFGLCAFGGLAQNKGESKEKEDYKQPYFGHWISNNICNFNLGRVRAINLEVPISALEFR